MQDIIKKILFVLFLCCAFIPFLFLASSSPVHADGGAPNLAYIAGGGQGVSVIDIAQRKVATTLTVKGDPSTVLLSLDGRLLYVAQSTLEQVTVIASKTKQVVCTAHMNGDPTLLAIDSAQNILYVAGNASSHLTALNSTTCAVLHTYSLPGAIYGLALANASGTASTATRLWIASLNELSIFDMHGNMIANLPFPQGPRFLCIPTGNTVYVTTQQGNVVAVDENTHHISLPLVTGKSFGPMDYDATTGEVYVPNMQEHGIDVLAPVTVGDAIHRREPSRVLHFDAIPQSIAITSDGQLGMIALANGTIAMLDVSSRQVITTITVGGDPRFIITGLYPPPFNLTQQQYSFLNSAIDALHYLGAVAVVVVTLIIVIRYRRLNKEAERLQK